MKVEHIVKLAKKRGYTANMLESMTFDQREQLSADAGHPSLPSATSWAAVVRQMRSEQDTTDPLWPNLQEGCGDRCHWHDGYYFHELEPPCPNLRRDVDGLPET